MRVLRQLQLNARFSIFFIDYNGFGSCVALGNMANCFKGRLVHQIGPWSSLVVIHIV